jgi:hypothetical protein
MQKERLPGTGTYPAGETTQAANTPGDMSQTRSKEMHHDRQVSRFTAIGALFLALSCTSVREAVAWPFDLTRTWQDR